MNIIKQVTLEQGSSRYTAKQRDEAPLPSQEVVQTLPPEEFTRLVSEGPQLHPANPFLLFASEMLICQRIIISCAACHQAVKLLALIYSFWLFGFSISLCLSALQNCKAASKILPDPNMVFLSFQNKSKAVRAPVLDTRPPPAQDGGSPCR